MIIYILRRIVAGIVLALLVTAITFSLLYAAGSSVARNILGPEASASAVARLNAKLGLNASLPVQYFDWLRNAVSGNLGTSYFTSEPVGPATASRLAVTMSVVVVALIVTAIVSAALGMAAAARGGAIDKALQGVALFGYVFPGLLLAIGLVSIFAITLHWVPATGYIELGQDPGGWIASIVLPVIALSVGGVAAVASQVRGTMIDELRKDYVRTLRTRGISPLSIVLKHALRNAASPALTTLSLQFVAMFGGALVIEKIFALPGFGTFAFNASLQGDTPVIMAVTLFSVGLVIIVNLAVDLMNGWLNPKSRKS